MPSRRHLGYLQGFPDFNPEQMVATQRGYLAVSGSNQVVKMQEVFAGCAFGTSFTSIGVSDAPFTRARIAAGTDGFAVVWDNARSIDARHFGPNLCD